MDNDHGKVRLRFAKQIKARAIKEWAMRGVGANIEKVIIYVSFELELFGNDLLGFNFF